MGGWLQKILTSTVAENKARNLPAPQAKTRRTLAPPRQPVGKRSEDLPTATVIYGIGASLAFVDSFSMFMSGNWILGIMVFIIGACLSGFALHHLKYRD